MSNSRLVMGTAMAATLHERLQADRPTLVTDHVPESTQLRETNTFGRKIGRNEICPCGSGLKFKKCCIRRVR